MAKKKGKRSICDGLRETAESLKQRPLLANRLQNIAQAISSGKNETVLTDELQRLLFPVRLPEIKGLDFSTLFIPSPTGASNLYDIYETTDGMVGLFLAEAPDTGLLTALMMIQAKVAFDEARSRLYSPAEILEELNVNMAIRASEDFKIKAFLGYIDLATLRIRYVNASMRAPILFGSGEAKPLPGKFDPLGKTPNPGYEEHEVSITPGQRLLLYSPGLTSATNREGKSYPVSKLKALLKQHGDLGASEIIEKLTDDLCGHVKDATPRRDTTLIAVEFGRELAQEVKIVIPTDPSQLSHTVEAIMDRLKRLNYGERSQFAIRLCLEEALINAMKHGNRMDRTKNITVTCQADEHEVRVSVEDEGDGFLPEAVPDPRDPENLEVAHGRGLLLMYSYMDSVEYCDKGNRVTLVKKAPWE